MENGYYGRSYDRDQTGDSEEKQPLLVRVFIRAVMGIALILVLNTCFLKADIDLEVGLNPFSITAVGALGVPGIVMLYGIAGCRYL